MKLVIAAITFAATLGMLFLIETGKSPKEDSARIIEALKEENASAAVLATPSPIKARTPTPTPILTPAQTLIPTPAPAPTQTPTKTSPPALPPASLLPSPTPSETPPTPTPTLSSPPQEAGQGFINILSVTSPVKQSGDAQVVIVTAAGASCSIKVILPSGNPSGNKNLVNKISDVSGNVSWSWGINWNTTPGTANIDITCSKDGQSFSKSLQMTIVER